MKRVFLFALVLSYSLFPQVLKEFDVKPTTNRGQIPIFRDFPDKAAIIFYTKFSNLVIGSSFGIVKQLGDAEGGKYIIVIEPTRQTIEVRGPGYKTEQIKIGDLQPRDVLYYEVLPKKEEGLQGVSELAITVQATPNDAKVLLDGATFQNNVSTKVSVGKHKLQVEKTGYNTYEEEIFVSPDRTLFPVVLSTNDPVPLTISSEPAGAEITIDGLSKGKTPKAIFLYPGTYELKLGLSSYLSIQERISVGKDETKNKFTYTLKKNTGRLKLEVTPQNATVRINKEEINAAQIQELTPGFYQIEAEAPTYVSQKTTVEIILGETKIEKINLIQKTGKLQFAITPPDAECILTQNGVEKYRWTGIKILNSIAEGTYDLTAQAKGYKKYTAKITIVENKSSLEEIQMIPGSDVPEGMVFVEGGTFMMGCTREQSGCESDENPVHQVTLKSFFVSKLEVTQAMWENLMRSNPSKHKGSNLPIEMVTWFDAIEFCNRLSEKEGLQKVYSINGQEVLCNFDVNGYRLLTEAEWEYAARGGKLHKGYQYSGSDDLDAVGWRESETQEVGQKQPNELGLFDMSGNVWEWCWDWMGEYLPSSQINPTGPTFGSSRVLRGGSWMYPSNHFRVANRGYGDPTIGRSDFGFRLARTK